MSEPRCHMIEIDGEMVRVQGANSLTDEDREALGEVIRAAKAKLAAEPPGPLSVACPACNVGVGESCRNHVGQITIIHHERRDLVSS